ncbi:hypothetical protein BDW66DRAFT_155466 [Aspergillus desertorum]
MKSFTLPMALLATLSIARAEISISQCASMCFNNMLSLAQNLGCDNGDMECLCETPDYRYGIRDCTREACPGDNAYDVLQAVLDECPGQSGGELTLTPDPTFTQTVPGTSTPTSTASAISSAVTGENGSSIISGGGASTVVGGGTSTIVGGGVTSVISGVTTTGFNGEATTTETTSIIGSGPTSNDNTSGGSTIGPASTGSPSPTQTPSGSPSPTTTTLVTSTRTSTSSNGQGSAASNPPSNSNGNQASTASVSGSNPESTEAPTNAAPRIAFSTGAAGALGLMAILVL